MQVDELPDALADRLGPEAAFGLIEVFDMTQREWTADGTILTADRFERRMGEEFARFRGEMSQAFSGIRQEMAAGRVELLKWSFVFWIGQVLAIAGIVALMTRRG